MLSIPGRLVPFSLCHPNSNGVACYIHAKPEGIQNSPWWSSHFVGKGVIQGTLYDGVRNFWRDKHKVELPRFLTTGIELQIVDGVIIRKGFNFKIKQSWRSDITKVRYNTLRLSCQGKADE